MVRTYEVERDVKMQTGDTTEVAGYVFTLRGLRNIKGPNYDAVQAVVDVRRNGAPVALMNPEKRTYRVQGTALTDAAIDRNLARDLYVSLGEPVEGGAWIVRVYVKPFVDWIWGGCLLMALGGALAASDRRYRAKQPSEAVAPIDEGLTATTGSRPAEVGA
jgi:cytochrome c-type biogenesis protein CcmF